MTDLLVVSPTGVSEQPLNPSSLRSDPQHLGMTARDAAKEFETMLIAAWMKTAREAGEIDQKEDEMTGADSYIEFAEKYVAEAIAETNVFGFADMIGDGLSRR